jgi:hypothetical protein
MVNRHNNQNNYNRRNTAILNVNQPKNKRKTLKLNNNNNYGPRIPTMRGPDEFKMAFPPTHIRDWTYETQRSLDPANINLGWMGANGNNVQQHKKNVPSVAHSLEAIPTDPLSPEPVPLKDLQPMNNKAATKATSQNTIFAHNLRGLAPAPKKRQTRVPFYAQATAASRARVKATDAPGRQKAMAEHYKKIGLTRRNKKSRKQK